MVDDEAAIRRYVRLILTRFGYAVIEAEDATGALGMCLDNTVPVRLVLTDINMPNMRGDVLAERLAAACPHIKVVLMSGDPEAVRRYGQSIGFCRNRFARTYS